MSNTKNKVLLSAAIAGIIGAGATAASSTLALAKDKADGKKVHCYGVNSCKGESACNTSQNSCKGMNSCKGKGFLEMTKAECMKKKGKLEEPKTQGSEEKSKSES